MIHPTIEIIFTERLKYYFTERLR